MLWSSTSDPGGWRVNQPDIQRRAGIEMYVPLWKCHGNSRFFETTTNIQPDGTGGGQALFLFFQKIA